MANNLQVFTNRNLYQLIVLLLYLPLSPPSLADTIALNNGRTFSGEIKKETATHITVDIGGGTISFRKSSIKSISKAESSESSPGYRLPVNANIELNPPIELIQLATVYKKLQKDRISAIKAKKNAQKFQNKREHLINKQTKEKQRHTDIVQQVNASNPNRDVRRYNDLVYLQNQSTNKLITIRNELSKGFEETASGKKIISKYFNALDELNNQVEDSKSKAPDIENIDQAKSFWTKIGKKLAQFDNEFKSLDVPHEQSNGHMILKVRINDNIEGRFLLDTGASYVTLSEDLAKRLNLNLSKSINIPLTLADGSKIDGKPVILKTMKVGDVQANRVTAMILPSPPGKSIDGLLGMSFLREFVINFDPLNKKLVFKRFDP